MIGFYLSQLGWLRGITVGCQTKDQEVVVSAPGRGYY